MAEVSLRPSPPQLADIVHMLPEMMQQAVHSIQRVKKDIYTAEQILHIPRPELQRIAVMSAAQATTFIAHISDFVVPPPCTLMDLVRTHKFGLRLSWGDPILDHYFRGGLNPTGITEIAGESAAGKSQLCMQLLLQAQLPTDMGGLDGTSVYLSTEGDMPLKRLKTFVEHYRKEKYTTLVKLEAEGGGTAKSSLLKDFNFMSNIFMDKVPTIDYMWEILSTKIGQLINKARPVKLIVIDSLAALFRVEYSRDEAMERSKVLWNYANQLTYISETYNICIVVINQVTAFFEDNVSRVAVQENQKMQFAQMATLSGTGGKVIPSLGLAWANCVNTRIIVSRTQRSFRPSKKRKLEDGEKIQAEQPDKTILRKMRVVISPNLPDFTCMFIVDATGVKGVETDKEGNTFTEQINHYQPTINYYAHLFGNYKSENEDENNTNETNNQDNGDSFTNNQTNFNDTHGGTTNNGDITYTNDSNNANDTNGTNTTNSNGTYDDIYDDEIPDPV